MTKFARFILVVGVSVLFSGSGWSTGSFGGNGADSLTGEWYSAWFLGERPIRWCVDPNGDIGVSRAVFKATVEEVFVQWRIYLQGKNLSRPITGNEDIPSLNLNTEYLSTCDETTDLTFYLGFVNPAIQEWINRFANPIAFSRTTSYDDQAGFGRGYVWLRPGADSDGTRRTELPNWSFNPNLKGLLLHEIGHILGCRHMPGTIMRDDIADVILGARFPFQTQPDEMTAPWRTITGPMSEPEKAHYDAIRTQHLTHIDYSRELYFLPSTGIDVVRSIDISDGSSGAQSIIAAWQSLIDGITPRGGKIHQKFTQWNGEVVSGNDLKTIGVLLMVDEDGYQEGQLDGRGWDSPVVWRFDLLLDGVMRQNARPLSDAMVFRRHYHGFTLPGYTATATRSGIIRRMVHNGVESPLALRISYERNPGRFSLANLWDTALIRVNLVDGAGSMEVFSASFFDQIGEQNGFYALPGGPWLE